MLKRYALILSFVVVLLLFGGNVANAQGQQCYVVDYETYPDGSPIIPGDYLNRSFTDWGIDGIIGSDPADGLLPIAFDSDNPTCGDTFLGPTGHHNVMVVQEKLSDCRPNAIATDHRLLHSFSRPMQLNSMIVYGTENDFTVTINSQSATPTVLTVPSQGINQLTWVNFPWWIEVNDFVTEAGGPFAVKELYYCELPDSPTAVTLSSFEVTESQDTLFVVLCLATVFIGAAILTRGAE